VQGNQVLQLFPPSDRHALVDSADYAHFSVGHRIARVADPLSTVFFPSTGVISAVREMTSGHHLAIAAVGEEGVVGLGSLFGQRRHALSLVVLVESTGYTVPSDVFVELFHRSPDVRQVVLNHTSQLLCELTTAAACNRVHSHRQRLASWLLTIAD
jgi:CRP-like cAMP-binding protein